MDINVQMFSLQDLFWICFDRIESNGKLSCSALITLLTTSWIPEPEEVGGHNEIVIAVDWAFENVSANKAEILSRGKEVFHHSLMLLILVFFTDVS